jgi:hypothetical protein
MLSPSYEELLASLDLNKHEVFGGDSHTNKETNFSMHSTRQYLLSHLIAEGATANQGSEAWAQLPQDPGL